MGLDAYLTNKTTGKEIKYWRKFGELQNLIADMAINAGLVDAREHFNCVDFELLEEDIDRIIVHLRTWNMPSHRGFFFGGSNKEDKEYIKDAIKVFKQVKKDVLNGDNIVYSSWW